MRGLVLLLIIYTFPSVAFELRNIGSSSFPSYRRWDLTKGPVHISLNARSSANVPLYSVETAVLQSLKTWQEVTGQSLRFQYDGVSHLAIRNPADFQNSITWVEEDWEYPKNIAAVTFYSYYADDPSDVIDSDILLNGRDFRWGVNVTAQGERTDIRQIVTHELGHLIGLSHSGARNASLFPYLPNRVRYSLSPDDKEGIRFLYGPPVASFKAISPVPNAVYSRGMVEKGLPLPVFRWGTASQTEFSLEFALTPQFAEIIRLPGKPGGYHEITAGEERRLERVSPDGRIYWRVRSGSLTTRPRALFFRE